MLGAVANRILIAVTSHADLGGLRPTGFYVPEAAEPWRVFTNAGYQVDVVSVEGGEPPRDGFDPDDPTQAAFVEQVDMAHTARAADVDGRDYDAVFYAGGHGTMWDFPLDPDIARLGRQVYEAGGVVAAVCHGPAALVNLTLADGSHLIAGKELTAFTNSEEAAVGAAAAVPFLLADALATRGATYRGAPDFTAHVVTDGRLVTGQNPTSATPTALATLDALAAAAAGAPGPVGPSHHTTPREGADGLPARRLGTHGPTVAPVGLGCMGMSQGYGPADDTASLATLQRAIDLGVTFWDTAMSYGRGHNEQLVGRALAGHRDDVVVATKFGIVRGPQGVRLDGRPENVAGYCEASLRRLGVDHIDLYYLHRVDPEIPVEETVGAMGDLVAQGKVRHLGLSEIDAEGLERAASVHPIAALQLEWSLWWREPEDDVVPAARRLGIGLVPYSPLGRGFLAGPIDPRHLPDTDFRQDDPRFGGEALDRNRARAAEVRRLAATLDATPAQLALAWLLAQGDDVVPIPGTRRPDRLAENAAAAALTLSDHDLTRLEVVAPRASWAGNRASFAAHGTTRRSA
jgi:aryl-alcohol dehydrogenase-like predicted oxidoreductase/putative intracellular protease/amidase